MFSKGLPVVRSRISACSSSSTFFISRTLSVLGLSPEEFLKSFRRLLLTAGRTIATPLGIGAEEPDAVGSDVPLHDAYARGHQGEHEYQQPDCPPNNLQEGERED